MRRIPLFAFALFALSMASAEAEEKALHPQLEAFRPILGKAYVGEFPDSTPEKPIRDIVSYERALNGQAIRSLHSINDGAYGGETVIRWDEAKQSLVYHYFTTQGFMTSGTMDLEDGKYTAFEEVSGDANGTTAVRSSGVFSADKIIVSSEYLQNGEWVSGHGATYLPDPSAKVLFR